MDGHDDSTTSMYLITLSCTLKNHSGGKFYYAYFITIPKKWGREKSD